MATEIVRTFLRGWLIQDPRLALPACIWSAHSSYTQAGPMAGLAVYDPTTTDLVLSATGTQTTATTLQVYSLDPGLVLDGSYCWKLSTASLWYGWETPITLSGWEAWEWTDGSGPLGILSTAKPHALTLPDGSVLCVVEAVRTVPGPITTYEVLCYKRNPTTGAITSSVVRLTSSAPVDGKHPCLLRNPNSGRLLCYSWLEAGATAQVYVCYSDDDGATWSVATRHGIKTCQNYVGSAKDAFVDTSSAPGAGAAGFALGRLRACWGRGGVMLLAGLVANNTSHAQDYLVQFASTDDGAVFNEVGRSGYAAVGPTSGAVWFDVVWNGSVFVVGMIEDAYGFPTAKRIPSVDSDISQWPEITVTPTGFATTAYWGTPYAGPITDSDCSLVLSDSGEIYFLGRIPGLTSECPIFVSTDGGITWRQLGNAPVGLAIESYGQWWTCGDSATHPKGLAGTWQHGRILCLHNWDAAPGNEDNSLGCAFLGGFSTQTLPNYIGAMGSWPDQVAWSLTWLPFDLPGDCLWTRTSTGGTDVLATGGLDLDSTAGTI
ncbi:MAG: sialidase family protein, partial [Thermoplasmata archaeon]